MIFFGSAVAMNKTDVSKIAVPKQNSRNWNKYLRYLFNKNPFSIEDTTPMKTTQIPRSANYDDVKPSPFIPKMGSRLIPKAVLTPIWRE
jgi:hypothetical protein